MIVYCDNCGNAFDIGKSFKGINATPLPCSFECFMAICRKYGKPISTNVKVKKNNKVKIFRSSLEEQFARLMDAKKVKYMFEPYIITKKINKKTRYYLPDFFLPNFNIFIEIKGDIWANGAYSKFLSMKQDIPILLITKEIMKVISKSKKEFSVKGVIDGATKEGSQDTNGADKKIYKEWNKIRKRREAL